MPSQVYSGRNRTPRSYEPYTVIEDGVRIWPDWYDPMEYLAGPPPPTREEAGVAYRAQRARVEAYSHAHPWRARLWTTFAGVVALSPIIILVLADHFTG